MKTEFCKCKIGNPAVCGADVFCIICGKEMANEKVIKYLNKDDLILKDDN